MSQAAKELIGNLFSIHITKDEWGFAMSSKINKEADNDVTPYIHIIQRPDGYAVFSKNLRRYGTFASLNSALKKARSLQVKHRGTILVHRIDGVIVKECRPIRVSILHEAETSKPKFANDRDEEKPKKLKIKYV